MDTSPQPWNIDEETTCGEGDYSDCHVLSFTRLNLGATLLPALWAVAYRSWSGLLVPLPYFGLLVLAGVLSDLSISFPVFFTIQRIVEWGPVKLAVYLVPAIAFGLRADGLAWKANPGRWQPNEYRKQQVIWAVVATAYWAVQILLNSGLAVLMHA